MLFDYFFINETEKFFSSSFIDDPLFKSVVIINFFFMRSFSSFYLLSLNRVFRFLPRFLVLLLNTLQKCKRVSKWLITTKSKLLKLLIVIDLDKVRLWLLIFKIIKWLWFQMHWTIRNWNSLCSLLLHIKAKFWFNKHMRSWMAVEDYHR